MARITRLAAAFLMLLLSSTWAQSPPGKVLDIESNVLDIVGIARGLEGTLKDLGAKVTEREIVIELDADVLFDFDKHDLRPAAVGTLTKVADALKEMGKAPATIEGHTDGKGSSDYNQKLSDRRAGSVKDWLITRGGVERARLTSKGFGMTRPLAPNTKPDGSDDPEGRRKNRRVEIRVKKS
jgi:outer membrane protein OmpA-like peptidoglycan-associated protein